MADIAAEDQMPEDWTPDEPTVEMPAVSVEGDAMIDDLAAVREERAREHDHHMVLPGYDADGGPQIWARYKLLGPKRTVGMAAAFADANLNDGQVTFRAAKFLADAVLDVYMKRDGRRIDFAGHNEERPASWLDLPPKLVPPRPAGQPHDGPSAVRALLVRDNVLVGHALDLVAWMQGANADVSEQFSGESEGGPR